MLCYFDSDTVNLSHIEEIRNVRPLDRLQSRLSNSNFTFIQSKIYVEQGLYIVEVSKHVPHWCGKSAVPTSINILQEIPKHVLESVLSRTLRIVIISIVEGDSFVHPDYDGFMSLHADMINLGLPKNSVLIVSGNLNADSEYDAWCTLHNFAPMMEFSTGIEWDGKDNNWNFLTSPIIHDSIKHADKSFNSLNRAHRAHRTDHLFYLAKKNLLGDGLVSGGHWFSESILKEEQRDLLLEHYPRTVDLSTDDLKIPKDIHPSLTANILIYQQSLLSVVTESHFSEPGLFITEKTFRPIALGHPFIVLGQPFLLKKMNDFGFKTNFLDTSYDSIIDDQTRFDMFHEQLLQWKKMPYNKKLITIGHWMDDIEHNFKLYKSLNFKKIMFDTVIQSSKAYF